MTGRIQEELKQRRPIGSLEEEAFLNLQRTANVLQDEIADLLRRHELTQSQYNVLRILRGAGEHGLTASDIGERMITRDPDVTRLVDRLEKRGLVERWRCGEDRRVVWTRISPEGRALIEPLDEPLRELHVAQLTHLGSEKLRTLTSLLEEARDRP
jgi:DNA-binding MarR family transcriptional regulator